MATPIFLGADKAWNIIIPIQDVLKSTPLERMTFENFKFWPVAVGFAFLVPADVSLSVWFFFLFSRVELWTAHRMALPDPGGTYGVIMRWQQAGAYIAFTVGMAFMARRHLWAVFRKALGSAGLDDSEEPISYRLAFWGFLAAIGGCLAWYWYHGMRRWELLTAGAMLGLLFCWFVVYARMVAQGGLYVGRTLWELPEIVGGLAGGRAFSPAGAVIAKMQSAPLVMGGTTVLAPMVINAFRISDVIKKRRRLLFPAMMVALLVAMACTSYTTLWQAYSHGAVNFGDSWGQVRVPRGVYTGAQRIITRPAQAFKPRLGAFSFGIVLMGFLMFMRARFYWWPIHSLGLLCCSSWHAHRLWFPFLLGWMIKVGIMKLAGGRMLRKARYFFVGLILVEFFLNGVSAIVSTVTHGGMPRF